MTVQNPSSYGIDDEGTLTLNGCTISHCTASGIISGNNATLNMYSCTVEWNSSANAGGGIKNNTGTLYCYDCEISNNSAVQFGGGISNEGGSVQLVDSSVIFNYAGIAGGGIYCDDGTVSVSGPMTGHGQTESLDLADNTAGQLGGGLYQTGSAAQATFTGAGIIGNQVSGIGGVSIGGGVCLDGGFADFGPWCVISGNSANVGTSIAYKNPGASFSIDDSCTIDSPPQAY